LCKIKKNTPKIFVTLVQTNIASFNQVIKKRTITSRVLQDKRLWLPATWHDNKNTSADFLHFTALNRVNNACGGTACGMYYTANGSYGRGQPRSTQPSMVELACLTAGDMGYAVVAIRRREPNIT